MAQSINHSPLDFEAQTKKQSRWFYEPNHQTAAANFGAQTEKPMSSILRLKSGENFDLSFKAKPRKFVLLIYLCTVQTAYSITDLLIVWPPSTRGVLYHSRSSAPSLILLSRSLLLLVMPHLSYTYHKTSKHVSLHKTYSRVELPKFLGFKFKPRQVNYSSQIKPKYWLLGFSILHNNKILKWFISLIWYPFKILFSPLCSTHAMRWTKLDLTYIYF
jgi:hypothetical protein